MNNTLNIRLKNKYDTRSNYEQSKIVLLQGEIAFDEQGTFKVGDGVRTWSQLPFVNSGGGGGGSTIIAVVANVDPTEDDEYDYGHMWFNSTTHKLFIVSDEGWKQISYYSDLVLMIQNVQNDISSLATTIADLQNSLSLLSNTVASLSGILTSLSDDVSLNTSNINLINEDIGSETLNTTSQTIKGAINEVNNNAVHKTGNETVSGTKTFSEPILSTSTSSTSTVVTMHYENNNRPTDTSLPIGTMYHNAGYIYLLLPTNTSGSKDWFKVKLNTV